MSSARILVALSMLIASACASPRPRLKPADAVSAALAVCPNAVVSEKFDPPIDDGKPDLPAGVACMPWPAGDFRKITSTFRDPRHPYTPGKHTGTDIYAPVGTSVLAPVPGEVVWTRAVAPCQDAAVAVRFGKGWVYEVHHLSRVDVEQGDTIVLGRRLGLTGGEVGAPGSGPWTTGSHLHFAMIHEGDYVDAAKYLCP